MKNTLILTALLLSSTSYANMYVRGGIGSFRSTTTEIAKEPSSGTFPDLTIREQGTNFNLGIGYNITDSFDIELGFEKDSISMSYGFGFNVRLFEYEKFSFFTKAGIAMVMYNDDVFLYSMNNTEYTTKIEESDAPRFNLGIGVEYDISDNFSIYSAFDFNTYSDMKMSFTDTNLVPPSPVITSEPALVKVEDNRKISFGVKYKF